jgi:hypothetical protein
MINNEDDDNDLNKYIKNLSDERRALLIADITRLNKKIISDFSAEGFYKGKDIHSIMNFHTMKLTSDTPIQEALEEGYQAAIIEALQTKEDAKQLVRLMLKIWDDDVDL